MQIQCKECGSDRSEADLEIYGECPVCHDAETLEQLFNVIQENSLARMQRRIHQFTKNLSAEQQDEFDDILGEFTTKMFNQVI